MKKLLPLLLLLCSAVVKAQDYHIQLNDTAFDISLGKTYDIVVKGKKLSFSVTAHDTLDYIDSAFSFKYFKQYTPVKVRLDYADDQVQLVTSTGSSFIIQRLRTLNPVAMEEVLLSNLIDQSEGFTVVRSEYQRTLASHQTVTVKKAVLTSNAQSKEYEVFSFGKKEEGVIVLTGMENDITDEGKRVIDLLWSSLKLR